MDQNQKIRRRFIIVYGESKFNRLVYYHHKGLNPTEVSKLLGLTYRIARYWLKKMS